MEIAATEANGTAVPEENGHSSAVNGSGTTQNGKEASNGQVPVKAFGNGTVSQDSLGGPREEDFHGFFEHQYMRMARSPCLYLWVPLLISFAMSGLAMTVGGFDASVDNAGWQSRGTPIADSQAQLMFTNLYQDYLFYGGDAAWDEVLNNVQPGWEIESEDEESDRRHLLGIPSQPAVSLRESNSSRYAFPFPIDHRKLEDSGYFDGCDVSWYSDTSSIWGENRLWPIWKAKDKDSTILNPTLLRDLCESELNTQAVLEENDLCFGCEDGCLPPLSMVLYARTIVPNGFGMDCDELSEAWAPFEEETVSSWAACVAEIKATHDPSAGVSIPESCPEGFSTYLVETDFDATSWMTYSASVFATPGDDADELYNYVDKFDKGTDMIEGAYDTQRENFGSLFMEGAVGRDMSLACGSAFITTIAMLVHTRSPLVTIMGLLQIILSFPLAFFFYSLVGQLDFFPFLNFIGVFVVFALGADNVFVVTDKWKNARLEHPKASVECIAAIALPDAAGAMFLTTITTAVAFFGTCICPVAPIKMFAVFCGLLIMFDYILCVVLVFPALCVYGQRLQNGNSNCCIVCHCCTNLEAHGDNDDDAKSQSLIRRILTAFYNFLHKFRYLVFALCMAGLGICIYYATTLELPTSADVRVVDEDQEYEKKYQWRQLLLNDYLRKAGGSDVMVGFGLTPADTGDLNNPASWTQLVLDDSFDPSTEESQEYLLSFCPALFNEEFAEEVTTGYTCPINAFAAWLSEQSNSTTPDDVYTSQCGGATGIPVATENFDGCFIGWSELNGDTRVLSYEGKVRIVWFHFAGRVRWDSPFDDLDDEWNLIENWFKNMNKLAPSAVSKSIFCSEDFWWYDTNVQMLSTAYGAAGIALGAAAGVILFSSRSFSLTFYAVVTIGYVLTSVTATLVGFGWTLGFLESICFAILIGVSVDFVIHFTHSYSHFKGVHSRGDRTKHALIMMGPSILAAAFTTIASATIMMFTIITFFKKFALILFMTIVQATIGSFIVFLSISDCFGPTDPTALFDRLTDCGERPSETHVPQHEKDDDEIVKC